MEKGRTYRRFIPVDMFDIPGLETWLADMAKKGFFLVEFFSQFAKFIKNEPKTVRYRVEPVGKDDYTSNRERNELFEASGWHFVAHISSLYEVFLAEDASAPELHPDPRIQSDALSRLSRRLIGSVIGVMACFALGTAFVIFTSPWHNIIGQFILFAKPLDLAVLLFFLYVLWMQIAEAAKIVTLRKTLRSGIPINHHKDYASEKAKQIAKIILYIVLLVLLLTDLAVNFSASIYTGVPGINDGQPPPMPAADIPVLRLADIDQGQNTGAVVSDGGTFLSRHSMLAPRQYTITQYGGAPGKNGGADSELTTDYYEMAFKCLARPVYEDKNLLLTQFFNKNNTYRALETDLFDRAAYMTDGTWQQLVVCKGKKVLVIGYTGAADLTQKLPLIAAVLNG